MTSLQEKLSFKALAQSTLASAKLAKLIQTAASLARRRMNEVDEIGWAHIHHAAQKGYFKSVEKFIKASDDQLEFETQDDLRETPLIVAVRAGMTNMETISIIIELGGSLSAVNNLNHGLVEICCLEGHTDLLEYVLSLDQSELLVWKRLLKFCLSDSDDEAECACRAVNVLTKPIDGCISRNWMSVFDYGGVETLVKIVKSTIGEDTKKQALNCLINILERHEVKQQLISNAALDPLIWHLRAATDEIVRLSSTILAILCSIPSYADLCSQKGVIPALVSALKRTNDSEVLVEVIQALGVICNCSEVRQTLLSNTPGSMQCLCSIYLNYTNPSLLLAICKCISKICRRHWNNQISFVEHGGASQVILLTDIKNKEIQLAAVDTIHMVVENNSLTQKMFIREGAVMPLISLLNKSKNQVVQEKAASALWAIAGEDGEGRRTMASTMGVNMLIDFLSSLSEVLHYIGCEGLSVLAQGAHNKQDVIASCNGVIPLVRLLKCDKEYLVLSALRSIRHLCVGVGYLPHHINQNTVSEARGIKLLTALLLLSKNELIQVEAALTMASVALGNHEVIKEVWTRGHLEFSYVRVINFLHSEDKVVRLLAGAALATFAYNNITQQDLIAAEGGVRFSRFIDFLHSKEEYLRCNAAFQVVVLARVIPDEEQAIISAAGIKLITDILVESNSTVIQALAADCVARLAHTRAGVPQGFVAIGSVNRLCSLMCSLNAQVRGCAAIALSYLSFNHTAERQLLNRCRNDPYLIHCLSYYTDKHKLSRKFKKEWNHYKRVGSLPPINEGRPSLVSQQGYRCSNSIDDNGIKAISQPEFPPITEPKSDSVHEFKNESLSKISKINSFHSEDGNQSIAEGSVSHSISIIVE